MKPLAYQITPVRQATSQCLQTAVFQALSFFPDNTKSLDDIVAGVQVSVDENGNKVGTSIGHMATYIKLLGYNVHLHVFDVELFDRSWGALNNKVLAEALAKRRDNLPTRLYIHADKDAIVEGYIAFLEYGGKMSFPQLSSQYLYDLLAQGPFVAMLSSTYLNRAIHQTYNKATDKFIDDAIRGRSVTHAVTVAGYQDGQFNIIDPQPPEGIEQSRWIPAEHLIASIATAQTESDNILLSISKAANETQN